MKKDFWRNKKVLITGHTGFQGSWLALWLLKEGAQVTGLSIDSELKNGVYNLTGLNKFIVDWRGDVTDFYTVNKVFDHGEFDIVFHLAGQSSIFDSFENPMITYRSNIIGTINILEAMKKQEKKMAGVFITADTIYEINEDTSSTVTSDDNDTLSTIEFGDNHHNLNITKSDDNHISSAKESDALGGSDPFSTSKACCEILINSYRKSFFNGNDLETPSKAIGSARIGYIIGGGDCNFGRIIPNLIMAHEENIPVALIGADNLVPCLHVLDALNGYITLAETLYEDPSICCEPFNFGPELNFIPNLKDLVESINDYLIYPIEYDIENTEDSLTTRAYSLDITKSKEILGWTPQLTFPKSIELTMDWYLNYKNKNVLDLCYKDIDKFMEICNNS